VYSSFSSGGIPLGALGFPCPNFDYFSGDNILPQNSRNPENSEQEKEL
jgi:hypothetical protein